MALRPVAAERARQRLVQIAAGRCLRKGPVPGQRGQDPRLELRGVGHHQHPAGIGDNRPPQDPRDLQRPAAARCPSPGHHAAHHVLRPEPAAGHPAVQPRPAVRGVQPGPAPCTQGSAPPPDDQPRGARRTWSSCIRTPSAAKARTSCAGESGLTRRPPNAASILAASSASRAGPLTRQPSRRPRPEHPGQQRIMHVSPPRQPGQAHLGRDQPARRLRRSQQPEPPRMLVRGDPPHLRRVHRNRPHPARPPDRPPRRPAARTACPAPPGPPPAPAPAHAQQTQPTRAPAPPLPPTPPRPGWSAAARSAPDRDTGPPAARPAATPGTPAPSTPTPTALAQPAQPPLPQSIDLYGLRDLRGHSRHPATRSSAQPRPRLPRQPPALSDSPARH